MKVLVTGSAGFIGMHTVLQLLKYDYDIVGLDNINNYYSVDLKLARLANTGINRDYIPSNNIIQSSYSRYRFIKLDLEERNAIEELFASEKFDFVIHLAAQAGVRYSMENPYVYIDSNIKGFLHILEACRQYTVKHLVYASSSSVYGLNTSIPYSEQDSTDHPISLYAATKKANEMMAHSYSHLYNLPTTGLRFFTVYGPWARPDMALFLFTEAIMNNQPVKLFNRGEMVRDFTYVDDVTSAIASCLCNIPVASPTITFDQLNPSNSSAPFKIYNVGNGSPVKLLKYIEAIEQCLNKKAVKIFMPIQAGDILSTHANIEALSNDIDYQPKFSVEMGVKKFVEWYLEEYSNLKRTSSSLMVVK